MKSKICLLSLTLMLTFSCTPTKQITQNSLPEIYNTVSFEVSPYGLIFTDVKLLDQTLKAMIDFGDPNILQFSSTFVKENKLPVEKIEGKMYDIKGNAFDINAGVIDEVQIGLKKEKEVKFSSSPNEMEAVAQQIGTEFHAVVGWGYFKKYHILLDYSKRQFLLNEKDPIITQPKATVSLSNNSSYLIFPIEVQGKKVNALLDTGSPVCVMDKTLHAKFDGKITSLTIGEAELPVEFHQEDLSMLSDMNVQAIIGGTFMSNYKIHIDPVKKILLIE